MPSRTLAFATSAAAITSLLLFALPAAAQTRQDLIRLFDEWRAFERPVFVDGVPDCSVRAMARQHEALESGQERLRELHPARWCIEQQID